jgi:diguanylate cyclase (GGDEF)-like protein/PAS domain S-box-containing protein
LRIALIYVAFGVLWILLSDRFLASFIADTTTLTQFQTYKGSFYVVITAALAFYLMRYELKKQALIEEKLRVSEERWKFALEGAGDGVWDWNYQTGDAMFSKRYKEMLGFAENEFSDAASEWSDRIHQEDMPHVIAAIQAHIDGKTPSANIEFRMLCKDGSWKWIHGRGMVVSRSNDGNALRLVGTNTDITERKRAEDKIHKLAFYDDLTGLANRHLISDRLEQTIAACKRSKRFGAMMLLDLDNFKPLNDTYGHDVGDSLLIEVAHRIRSCVREIDTVARFGGDEFMVLIGELDTDKAESATQAGIVAEKIRAILAEPYVLKIRHDGKEESTIEHYCTASIGVALFINHEGSAADIVKWADLAMYQAKDAGRNQFSFMIQGLSKLPIA